MGEKTKHYRPATEIDGGAREGGGQILRLCMSLSALMNTPVHVTNIRTGGNKPGLKLQQLKGLVMLESICQGELKNAFPESTEVTFYPGRLRGGSYEAHTQTVGVAHLLQMALPCVLFANQATILKLSGGTNADTAPQIDSVVEVFRPILKQFGASFDYKLLRRGYFPKGGGEVHVKVRPVSHLEPIVLMERGSITKIWGWAFVAGGVPLKVAQTIGEAARKTLVATLGPTDINIECYKESFNMAPVSGSGINLVCRTSGGCFLGGSALGRTQLRAEYVGQTAANDLLNGIKSGGCIDSHCQDQIIIFMALARGISQIRTGTITEATQTAIRICETLTEAKFNIVCKGSASNIIRCTGIGLKNHNFP